MRSISLVLVCFVALATLPLTAAPLRNDREVFGPRTHIVRIIKTIFGLRTNSDGLMPPVPATPPHP
jgi:hypothetical protein